MIRMFIGRSVQIADGTVHLGQATMRLSPAKPAHRTWPGSVAVTADARRCWRVQTQSMRRRWLTALRNPKTSRPSCSVQSFGLWRVVSTDQICPQIRKLCAAPLFREAPNAAEIRSDLSRLAGLGGCPSLALEQVDKTSPVSLQNK